MGMGPLDSGAASAGAVVQTAHGAVRGCVADGATFKSLGRKRTPQGRSVIARHHADLVDAERVVNEIYFAWRVGRPTAADDELDAMLERWKALPEGGEVTLEWRHSARAATRR